MTCRRLAKKVIEVNDIVGKDGVVLLGTDATETAFKSASLVDFKIIHIAAHGFADTQFPERSGLVLGVDPTSHDDGLLQVREIIRLRFNATHGCTVVLLPLIRDSYYRQKVSPEAPRR